MRHHVSCSINVFFYQEALAHFHVVSGYFMNLLKRMFRASDSALQIISEAFIEFKGKKNDKLGKIYD